MTFASAEHEHPYDQPSIMEPAATPPAIPTLDDVMPPWATGAIAWGKNNLPVVVAAGAIAVTIAGVQLIKGVTADTPPDGGNLPVAEAPVQPGITVEDARRQIETQIMTSPDAHAGAMNQVISENISTMVQMRVRDYLQVIDGTAPTDGPSRLAVVANLLRDRANDLDATLEVPPGATEEQRRQSIANALFLTVDLLALGAIANTEDGKAIATINLTVDLSRGANTAGGYEIADAARQLATEIDKALRVSDSYRARTNAKFDSARSITVPVTPEAQP